MGTPERCYAYDFVQARVFADQESVLEIEFSTDGVNWDFASMHSIPAGVGRVVDKKCLSRYYRVVLTNSSLTDQAVLRLSCSLKQGQPADIEVKLDSEDSVTIVHDALSAMTFSGDSLKVALDAGQVVHVDNLGTMELELADINSKLAILDSTVEGTSLAVVVKNTIPFDVSGLATSDRQDITITHLENIVTDTDALVGKDFATEATLIGFSNKFVTDGVQSVFVKDTAAGTYLASIGTYTQDTAGLIADCKDVDKLRVEDAVAQAKLAAIETALAERMDCSWGKFLVTSASLASGTNSVSVDLGSLVSRRSAVGITASTDADTTLVIQKSSDNVSFYPHYYKTLTVNDRAINVDFPLGAPARYWRIRNHGASAATTFNFLVWYN